jgi:serine/threonine protein kinase
VLESAATQHGATGMRTPSQPEPGQPSTASYLQPPEHGRTAADADPPELPELGEKSVTAEDSARTSGSSLVTLLPAAPGSSAAPPQQNTDDAPTIITPPRSSHEPTLDVVIGRRLGHFELLETVGSGGMAAVIKARDLELGRIVALKILPPHMAKDPENVTRFKQEGRAAAKLDHENIARAFYCGEDQGLHFIAFEFVEGETLRALIERRGTLSTEECIRYLVQIAAGLSHAAARGVVHRDIKPSNLIVTPDGRVKIVDMGLARHLESHSVNGGVTQSGMTLGTFDYISPEQALDPRRADVRSDIYSLGCSFYHALTGRPPVPEGTAAKKLYAHQHEPVIDPRDLNPAIPDGMAAILAKMMAKDPNQRYQTPAELVSDLLALSRMMDLPADSIPGDHTFPHEQPTQISALGPTELPRLPIGLAIVGAAIAIVIAIYASATRPRAAVPPLAWGEPPTADLQSTTPALPSGRPGSVPAAGTSPPEVAAPSLVSDTKILAELLQLSEPETEIRLEPGRTYDLTEFAEGIRVQGKKVRILGNATQPPTLRLAAVPVNPTDPGGIRPKTLTFADTSDVSLEGIRLEFTDGPPIYGRPEDPVGLVCHSVGRCNFLSCRFESASSLEAAAITGLVISAPRGPSTGTDLQVSHCYVAVRQTVAFQLLGAIRATVTESAFAPHQAVFTLKSPANDSRSGELTLRHCTFLLDQRGVVAEASESARWLVSAGYSVFATPAPLEPGTAMMMAETPVRPAVLKVKTASADFAETRFAGLPGERNVYFGVDPFATNLRSYSFDDYRHTGLGDDPAAWESRSTPWALPDPASALEGVSPWQALRLRLVNGVRVRGEVIVGVRFLPRPDDKLYLPWPPTFESETPVNPRQKIWWPDQPADDPSRENSNVYRALEELVRHLNPEDELLIRGSGELKIPQIILDKKVTIKPYPGSNPILIPADENQRSLFRQIAGDLLLDGLEFRLPRFPETSDAQTMAVISLSGARKLTVQKCVITLDGRSIDRFAVTTVAPLDDTEPGTAGGVQLEFEQCLIRGRGQGVWVKASRRFDLAVTNSVIALTSPLLSVDPALRDSPMDATAKVRLTRVTTALAGPLMELQIRSPEEPGARRWVPLKIDADECLFAPAATVATSPLIIVSGAGTPEQPQRYFTWQSTRSNWYPGRADGVFLRITSSDPLREPAILAATDWFALTREDPSKSLGEVQFVKRTLPSRLMELVPGDLEVLSVSIPGAEPGAVGVDIGEVPRPSPAENRPAP